MRNHLRRVSVPLALLAAVALAAGACQKQTAKSHSMTAKTNDSKTKAEAVLAYPESHRSDLVEDLHGTKVADPYRWLEDPDSPETRAWVQAQNAVTEPFLASIPARERIRARMTQLWNYEKWGTPMREGGRFFWFHNDGLQAQSVLHWAPSLDAEPKVLIDPNELAADGTVSLAGLSISEDGKLVAYGLSAAGSDWQEWKVREVDTGRDRSDLLRWVKFSGASWTKDGKGFFYSRFPEPKSGDELEQANYFQKLYYHRVGTPQSEDVLVYERPDHKEWGFDGHVTDDGKYLVITVWKGTDSRVNVYAKDLTRADAKVVPIAEGFDAEYSFVDNDGPVFLFKNDLGAPRGRLIAIDVRKPQPKNWKVLIPERKGVLRSVDRVGDQLLATYLEDAYSVVRVHALDGKHVRDVELPGIGTASGFTGEREHRDSYYSFTSYLEPATIYRYDLATGKSTVVWAPKVDFDKDGYVSKQVFFTSKDGTRVPMFISHKKGLVLDGKNPTYLYGYGGFNVSLTPGFGVPYAVWMEMGGVYAVANLRGGGEYGKEWHDAGRLKNKQNVFDDFVAAAEWLVGNKYTSPAKLSIGGGSNGGLLVGAAMTQRPDLFAAAFPEVGVLDMLRFHKFTIGWAWVDDYGSPEDPDMFEVLHRYSPLHNVKPGTMYPATMIVTGDHDDRVVPAHSYKFAAALQHAQSGNAPVLIRIETRAGHGAGKPTAKKIAEEVDMLSFAVKVLGMDVPELKGSEATTAEAGEDG